MLILIKCLIQLNIFLVPNSLHVKHDDIVKRNVLTVDSSIYTLH